MAFDIEFSDSVLVLSETRHSPSELTTLKNAPKKFQAHLKSTKTQDKEIVQMIKQ